MTTTTPHSAVATPLSDSEIDRLVALKIMHWLPDDDCPRGYRPCWSINQGQNDGPYYEEWNPSANIADAWRVLEQFRYGAGKGVILCDFENGWICDISDGGNFRRAEADTAPRAICLASLMAVQP